jgi:hypothetical protein
MGQQAKDSTPAPGLRVRVRRRRAVFLFTFLVGIGLSASVALALNGHSYSSGFGGGELEGPEAVAVDQASGDVYVLDVTAGAVKRFDSSGAPRDFSALGSPPGSTNILDGANDGYADPDATPQDSFSFDAPSAAQLAFDNSGGPADGDLYVTDSLHGEVDVFDSSGAYWGHLPLSAGEPCGVAVGSGGTVYIAYRDGSVRRYSAAAEPANASLEGTLQGLSEPCGLAVNASGELFVVPAGGGPLRGYDSSQFGQPAPTSRVLDESATAVSVDPSTNRIYADEGTAIAQLNPNGSFSSRFGEGDLTASKGVAVRGSTNTVYGSSSTGEISVFTPAILPEASTGAATSIAASAATLAGRVGPSGGPPASCVFEYGTSQTYGATAPCAPAGPFSISTAVSARVSSLAPSTVYHFRVSATNPSGTNHGADQTFRTLGAPVVSGLSSSDLATTTATLHAGVDPEGAPTHYRFEYVTEAQFEAGGFAGAVTAPSPDGDAGASAVTQTVSQSIFGLTPDTAYRYRMVAVNSVGTTTNGERTFRTLAAPGPPASGRFPGQGFLPDNRAWELVSPPNKNGGDVMPFSSRARVAQQVAPGEPMAMQFASFQGFAGVEGGGPTFEYVSQRLGTPGTSGWTTHGITPYENTLSFYQAALGGGLETRYEGEMSADLSKGVIASYSPQTEDPDVAEIPGNLYLRSDLRDGGRGGYQLLTACPGCTEPIFFGKSEQISQRARFLGSSSDFSHILFEVRLRLTADAPSCAEPVFNNVNCLLNLYEWHNGAVTLAGVLPDSACASPPCIAPSSMAGVDFGNNTPVVAQHMISADGRRIFFTVLEDPGEPSAAGALYMRVDNGTPQARTVQISGKAEYQDASTDGSRMVYEENGALMMYSVQPSDENQQLTVDASAGSFRLGFGGQTTGALPFDASAGEVESALDSLSSIGGLSSPGSVRVGGGPGGPGGAGGATPYSIVFGGSLAGVDVEQISTENGSVPLSGGSASAVVFTQTQGGHYTKLNADREPADGEGSLAWAIGMSSDGSSVYFTAHDQLVDGGPAVKGLGLYRWHEGALAYIGAVPNDQEEANENRIGPPFKMSRISADGAQLLFTSRSGEGLTGVEQGGSRQIYIYNADDGRLTCASCDPGGAATIESARVVVGDQQTDGRGVASGGNYLNHALSADGHYAFFSTPTSLVPEDTNGAADVYEYDLRTNELHLLTSGEASTSDGSFPSYFLDASADGKDVIILTREQLSGWDYDKGFDAYDARVDGGFPEPPPVPPGCQGDACQPPPVQLNDPTPSSASFSGAGNVKAKKHRHRHRSHRVRHRHHHHRHKARHRHSRGRLGRRGAR